MQILIGANGYKGKAKLIADYKHFFLRQDPYVVLAVLKLAV